MREKETLQAILSAFRARLCAEEKSAATVEKYCHDAAALLRFLGGRKATRERVIAWKQSLVDGGYAVASINSMLAAGNAFLSFLGLDGLRVRAVKRQRRIYCPEERELTRAEYRRLLSAAQRRGNERLCLLLQTLCATGIRVSELAFITVEAARRGEAAVRCKGKTRAVFLVKELQKRLARYAARHGIVTGPVFITRTGKPMSRTNVWREMKGLCAEAGVDARKVFPHNLRHLFARVFYGLEKDLARLADLLGHSSIETTRIYIISTGTEHRRFMEQMRLVI